jgi:hypothetical protein
VKQLTVPLLPNPNVPKSSSSPRYNSFDCSLNRNEITVLLFYIHAHNHKSTEDDNVSIPYHYTIGAQATPRTIVDTEGTIKVLNSCAIKSY